MNTERNINKALKVIKTHGTDVSPSTVMSVVNWNQPQSSWVSYEWAEEIIWSQMTLDQRAEKMFD